MRNVYLFWNRDECADFNTVVEQVSKVFAKSFAFYLQFTNVNERIIKNYGDIRILHSLNNALKSDLPLKGEELKATVETFACVLKSAHIVGILLP